MKKLIVGMAVIACMAVMVGCTSVNTSDAGSANVYPKTVGPVDNYRPLYKVDEKTKVSADAKVNVLFGIFVWGDDSKFADNASLSDGGWLSWWPSGKNVASKAAFYKACKENKCDAVVAARYEIETKDYFVFQKMNVNISGYPATMTGIETVKPLPFFVDGKGEIIMVDKVVTPYLLYNANSGWGW